MESMPPLEYEHQTICMEQSHESKTDTQQLANKDVFEINECSNYDQSIRSFVYSITTNNKCQDAFCAMIKCLNPLSITDRQILAKHLQNGTKNSTNKADTITVRGWNVINSSSNLAETTIVCYLIEYAHYAVDHYKADTKINEKKNEKNENFRKKIFDKLNNFVRQKLKLNALSLDVLSLIISCHFISSLSSKSDGFFRSLLKSYLPTYLTRFPMNGTHFMRLFDSVIFHRKQFNEKKIFEQFFAKTNENIHFEKKNITHRIQNGQTYNHLFDSKIIYYILKQIICINHKPESVDIFIINLTNYAMNVYFKDMNAEFICVMLCVLDKYKSKLNSNYVQLLYNKCCALFKSPKSKLNIILLSKIFTALHKLKYLSKFIKFIADDKVENVTKIFDKEIIKKSGINILHSLISKCHNIDNVLSDTQFIGIKKAFVSITVQIAKEYTTQTHESTVLLSVCAKSMIKFDEKSKNLKKTSIFDKREFEKLIWCFGFAKYRNDNFWKDLYGKVKKLTYNEISSDIITKFAWSIARVKAYLSKYKKDTLIHGPMIWCVKNSCDLISKQQHNNLTSIFTLEQLSTLCWSISICGKPGTQIENNYNDRALKHYIKLFDYIVSNIWEVVDCELAGEPQFYMNILSAMLTYKDELLADDKHNAYNKNKMLIDIEDDMEVEEDEDSDCMDGQHRNKNKNQCVRDKVIEFVIHVLNQFNISQQGQKYMKEDPNIIDFLLHIAAEFRKHVVELKSNANKLDVGNVIPVQMVKQINKMLQYLQELRVDIPQECAFSICCTLSRIPYNEQLTDNKHAVLNFLCNLIIKCQMNKNKEKRGRNKVCTATHCLMLDYTLGLCSAICAHSINVELEWDENVISTLLKSAKHYLYQKDKWSENHFLLKNHLQFFIDKFDKK